MFFKTTLAFAALASADFVAAQIVGTVTRKYPSLRFCSASTIFRSWPTLSPENGSVCPRTSSTTIPAVPAFASRPRESLRNFEQLVPPPSPQSATSAAAAPTPCGGHRLLLSVNLGAVRGRLMMSSMIYKWGDRKRGGTKRRVPLGLNELNCSWYAIGNLKCERYISPSRMAIKS